MDSSTSRHSLNPRASQQTLISLMELDPSPIESPASSDDGHTLEDAGEDSDTIVAASSGSLKSSGTTTSAPGLGSHAGRGTIFYLSRIQRYSSYAMSVFTTLHLANVSLIPAVQRSVPSSEAYLLMAREVYQTTLTEPLLVFLPVAAHVASGVALRLFRRRDNFRRYGGGATPGMYALHKRQTAKRGGSAMSLWPPLSYISVSGYVFTLFYGAHVAMNRVLPLAVEGDSSNIGLAWVAHGFARHPVVARVAYVGLMVVGSGHMVWGLAKWWGYAPSTAGWQASAVVVDKKTKRARRNRWLAVQAGAVVAIAAWFVGGMGVVARGGLQEGWVGKVYDDMFARVGL